MTLFCSLCSMSFTSLILDQDLALNEVGMKLIKHGQAIHVREFLELQQNVNKLLTSVAWLLHMVNMVKIPESETFVHQKIDESTKIFMGIMGNFVIPDGYVANTQEEAD